MQVEMFPNTNQRAEPRTAFWTQRWSWPDSTPEFVFLGEAVLLVGKYTYGEAWTGNEPATFRVTPLPDGLFADVDSAKLKFACSLLEYSSVGYRARCMAGSKLPMPTADEWAEAVALSQEIASASQLALDRFWDVGRRLSLNFKSGTIHTALRPFDGGAIKLIDPDAWNTENWWSRFHTCQLDPAKPYARDVVPSGGLYVFVERASLFAAMNQSEVIEADQKIEPVELYLSPFLEFMVHATRTLKITADNQPKKLELMALLPDLWTGDEPLSPTDVKNMATFMRSPDRKKGRGRKEE